MPDNARQMQVQILILKCCCHAASQSVDSKINLANTAEALSWQHTAPGNMRQTLWCRMQVLGMDSTPTVHLASELLCMEQTQSV